MNTIFASTVAAAVLSISAVASPAFAYSYNAPVNIAAVAVAGGLEGRAELANFLDAEILTTGSIGSRHGHSSASDGNAEQNNFPVSQYGQTSGGPRY